MMLTVLVCSVDCFDVFGAGPAMRVSSTDVFCVLGVGRAAANAWHREILCKFAHRIHAEYRTTADNIRRYARAGLLPVACACVPR